MSEVSEMISLSGATQKAASGNAKSLIIFLHGVGSNGDDLIGLAPYLSQALPHTAFVSPNAPFRYDMLPPGYPGGYQWFSLQDRADGALSEGVKQAEPIVNAYIDEQMAAHGVTPAQTMLFGFSQGTMTSLYVAPRRAEPLAGVVGFSGAMVAAAKLPREVKSKPPVCLIHGEMDDVVPFEALALAERSLKAAEIPVETHACPSLGHSIDEKGMAAAVAFIQRRL